MTRTELQGHTAGQLGVPLSANPYRPGTRASIAEGREERAVKRETVGWSYAHNPLPWGPVKDCGCEDCADWFADHPEVSTIGERPFPRADPHAGCEPLGGCCAPVADYQYDCPGTRR